MRKRIGLTVELTSLALVVAVLAVVTLIAPASDTKQAAPFAPAILGGQPPGALVLAEEDKDLAVALALRPQGKSLLAVVTVLDQNGTGASGLKAMITVRTADNATVSATAEPGTLGTYQATLATSSRPVSATVTMNGAGSSSRPLSFTLPAAWPPKPADALMTKVDRAYARLKTLVTRERLASNPTDAITSVYKAVAPDSLSIDSSNGVQAIILGDRRWDNVGGGWRQSNQSPPLKAIAPYWSGIVQDPVLIGATSLNGRAVWIVSFAAPQFPAFFQIKVDKKTSRVLDLRMTASAHFMHHRYGPFNAPLEINPPP